MLAVAHSGWGVVEAMGTSHLLAYCACSPVCRAGPDQGRGLYQYSRRRVSKAPGLRQGSGLDSVRVVLCQIGAGV